MRISDWSSDVCSSDLTAGPGSPHKTDNTGSIDMLGKFRPRHYLLSTTLLGSAACISPASAQDLPGGETVIVDAAPIVANGSRIPHPNPEQSSTVEVVGEIGRAPCRESVCRSECNLEVGRYEK